MVARADADRGQRGQQFSPKTLSAEDELWHDIALALGGRSVAEWKEAISEEERSAWLTYIQRRGTINPLRRMDGDLAALAAAVMNAANRKKAGGAQFEPADFMHWGSTEEPDATIEDVMTMLIRARVK